MANPSNDIEQDDVAPGEATLLVSEFPPPPFYYRLALDSTTDSSNTESSGTSRGPGPARLTPPPIPTEALARGTRRAAAAAARVREEAERLRLEELEEAQAAATAGADKTQAILGGSSSIADPQTTKDAEDEGDVVAVFGEVVEDPLLVQPLDLCEDPRVVRDEVKRLNEQALLGFVKLVQDLVHRPTENKKTRDELSHNIFLMLQQCNKFREHQAREILIELLEKQLASRRRLLEELQQSIDATSELLDG